ncbi:hypothetical protein HDA32_003294 [Spinactinospora alkalitolerans]|uniref:Uncharacterized protein n=1 Tax=Spinactinospora alkalitolerans TaxID=687207 RepID=A0A852U1Y4_9ACTN|nr:hypothetical protein [Spinactinospora alkalitolerans]NYE48174.1 hypothetical protein [Spinactinospora alkalitolerans]
MTSAPFEPEPDLGRDEIAAADPGPGAPPQAPGFGVEAEDPDQAEQPQDPEDEDPDQRE